MDSKWQLSIHKEHLEELKELIADAQTGVGSDAAFWNDPTRIDDVLREQARELDHHWGMLILWIGHARDREIHKDLGFKSWPDYIADVARTEMPNIARSVQQRRQVVGLLAGEGMSQRAIADAVGVSQKTVDRDLDQVSHDDSPCPPTDFADSAPVTALPDTVTGRDGKSYPAKPKPKPDVPKPQPGWHPTEQEAFEIAGRQEALNHYSRAVDGLTAALAYARDFKPPSPLPERYVSVAEFKTRLQTLVEITHGWEQR
jgi:hypothetical protein